MHILIFSNLFYAIMIILVYWQTLLLNISKALVLLSLCYVIKYIYVMIKTCIYKEFIV